MSQDELQKKFYAALKHLKELQKCTFTISDDGQVTAECKDDDTVDALTVLVREKGVLVRPPVKKQAAEKPAKKAKKPIEKVSK